MNKFILWLGVYFLATFSISFLYYKFTDAKKAIDLKIILVYLFGVISSTIIKYYDINFLSSLFYFIYFPIMFTLLNKKRLRELLCYLVIIWLYGFLIDMMVMGVVSLLNIFYPFDIYSYVFQCLSTVVMYLIIFGLTFWKRFKNFTNKLYFKIMKIKYLDISLIAFSLFDFLMGAILFLNLQNLSTDLLLILLIVSVSFALISLFEMKINEEENVIFLDTLKANNEFYMKMEDENRVFRHNLNAKLLSIKSVANKKARLLIDDLLYTNKRYNKFANKIKVIPYGLNGIIYEKLYPYIAILNIKMENNINYDVFKVLTPRKYNVLLEKLVIVLDNAIEATIKSKKKILIITLSEMNKEILITVKNTFSDNLSVDDLGIKNYSTKGLKRGLGLFSAFRNNEVKLSVKIINDVFETEIKVKKRLD